MARLLFRLWLLLIMPSMAVSGQITHIDDFASQYDAPRSIRIWTPDNYPAHAPYRVIYMHDGQMLFDARKTWNGQEWGADETAQKLHDAGDLPGFIIVGIDARANAARYGEYFRKTRQHCWRHPMARRLCGPIIICVLWSRN